ncbi:pseudouridine synthase [Cohnella cholangitidis]|uniref:Pseudouridine synthase n=1 Tax=Cohnella cholangitidis TaxID=2598458 RepID=A0A7G5C3W4_9BACL|nr:pseudouridine synthase [Cohnella cholangitidis]QMV43898.1 rRNA pseudouridine synthase [Cohnella cholangitidis]
MKTTIRLDKMLGNLGYGTRSGIKQLIKQGAVTVNGKTVKDHGMQINPNGDEVALDGETIQYRDTVYVLLHKPAGVVSATEDHRDRTVIDLLDEDITVLSPFPVGRLDKDTEGLLLITNDGKLSHELLSPRKHVPKTYRALVAGAVGQEDAEAFGQGVTLDDGYVTMPAQLRVLATAKGQATPSGDEEGHGTELTEALKLVPQLAELDTNEALSWIELTIHEGKFHQVKRMFESVGKKVLYLRRVSMGPLLLDPSLAPGEWRELTEEELESLRNFRKDGKQ